MTRRTAKCPRQGLLQARVAVLLLVATLVAAALPTLAASDNNVRLHGALVAEPCVIPPGDEVILLDFGTINDKYLYMNTRTLGQTFQIHLEECDLTVGKAVRVTFTGVESNPLPGLLALDGSSGASGIAIGFETLSAEQLPLNKESSETLLQSGTNIIALKAYVQGEPEALTDRSIELGPFSAVATFHLEYE